MCEHHDRLNCCTAKVWLHGCKEIQLGDTILDLLIQVGCMGKCNGIKKRELSLVKQTTVPQKREKDLVCLVCFCLPYQDKR